MHALEEVLHAAKFWSCSVGLSKLLEPLCTPAFCLTCKIVWRGKAEPTTYILLTWSRKAVIHLYITCSIFFTNKILLHVEPTMESHSNHCFSKSTSLGGLHLFVAPRVARVLSCQITLLLFKKKKNFTFMSTFSADAKGSFWAGEGGVLSWCIRLCTDLASEIWEVKNKTSFVPFQPGKQCLSKLVLYNFIFVSF